MKFTQKIVLYRVNDDNTVTFHVTDEHGNEQYFRANACLKLLIELCSLSQGVELVATLTLHYSKSNGLTLRIVDVNT